MEVLSPVAVALDDRGDVHLGEFCLEILESEDRLRHPLPRHGQGVLLECLHESLADQDKEIIKER